MALAAVCMAVAAWAIGFLRARRLVVRLRFIVRRFGDRLTERLRFVVRLRFVTLRFFVARRLVLRRAFFLTRRFLVFFV